MAESGPWDDFKKTEIGPWSEYAQKYDATGYTKAAPKKGQTVAGSSVGSGGPLGAMHSFDSGMTELGGRVTDATGSPALGVLTKMLPDLASLPLSALGGAKVVGVPLSNLGKAGAKDMMGRALTPTPTQWLSGEGKVAVDTMLEKGLPVSTKGVMALETELKSLQNRVSAAIANSGGTVPKSDVVRVIKEAKDQFRGGTSEISDLKIIDSVVKEFEKAPSVRGLQDIPVQVAQRMKVLEGQKMRDYYGVPGMGPEIAARKGTTRGLKEGIEQVAPEVKGLNAQEQKIYQTLPVLERRAMIQMGRDPVGFTALAHNPAAATAVALGKSSLFKSWLANKLNQFANSMIPQGIGAAGGMGLHEIGKDRNALKYYYGDDANQ